MLPDPLDYMMLKKHADDVSRTASRLFTPAIPKGRLLVRGLVAKTIGREHGVEDFAIGRWGPNAGPIVTRAAVAAVNTTDSDLDTPAAEFFGLVMEQSIIGRLPMLRQVVPNTRILSMVSGATGYWVGEGKAVPLSWQSLAGSSLSLMKVSALVCVTKEALEAIGEVAEQGLQQDLTRAVTAAIDEAFVDPDNSGIPGHMPPSVTNGAIQIPSAGTDAEDLRFDIMSLFGAYAGDLTTAALIMNPRTCLQISLLQQPLGNTDLTVNGGSLFGLPVIASKGVPYSSSGGSIVLLDQASIAYATGAYQLKQSTEASLEMADDPTTDTAPAGQVTETTFVSLFQTNTVAFMSTVQANWQVQGEDKVVVLTEVDYLGVS